MKPSDGRIYRALIILLLISLITRGYIASIIELGNDEVYYWTYANYPALSHFDHPPMVGLMIQLFTLNLTFEDAFFIRLAAVVLGTLSTWLMFLIGTRIRNTLTGLMAAFLFTASFYGFVISGLFIMPDAPQVFFWLLTLYFYVSALPDRNLMPASRRLMVLAGLTGGLALLSKYHSLFLLAGMVAYVVLYNRKWMKTKELYIGILLFVAGSLPILIWNLGNDFISFSYHENRVGATTAGFQPQYFLTELAGQFFYNNPVNVIIIISAILALIFNRKFLPVDQSRIILLISVPLLLVFTSFSLFRSTLPHWTGPGYLGLLLVGAAYLSDRLERSTTRRLLPFPALISVLFLGLVLVLAVAQIRFGLVDFKKWNSRDIAADMTGWKELGDRFAIVAADDIKTGRMERGAPILTFRWFPAANLDYYVGTKTGHPVYAIGTLERIHKYHWINQERGDLRQGTNAYYLGLSDDYQDPAGLYGSLFDTILPPDTIYISRRTDTIRMVYVYRMRSLKGDLSFP